MAASAVLCSFALLSGCSDDDVCKVYIPEAKTLQIKNFDLGEELREVFHVAVTASDYVTRSGKEVGGDVKVQLTVDEAKVQEYNSLCGTDYPLLPSDCYTLTTETVIPAGESSSADLVLTVNAQGKIQPFDSYLLPVTRRCAGGSYSADGILPFEWCGRCMGDAIGRSQCMAGSRSFFGRDERRRIRERSRYPRF